jgi:glycerol-3-phosphate O-acyltransferase
MARIVLACFDGFLRRRPRPEPFSSGVIRDWLLQGMAGFMPLIRPHLFLRRFRRPTIDPLVYLIDLQKTIERPIFIIPQVTFFSRRPRRSQPTLLDMLFGPEDQPGRLRLLAALFQHPGHVFVEISAPIDLRHFLVRPDLADQPTEYQAAILRSDVLDQINRHRQTITGPVLKTREELHQRVLDGERFQKFMQSHAEMQQMSLPAVRASAEKCIEEISADLRPNWIRFYSAIVGWILRTLFDGVTMNRTGLSEVKRMALRGAVVYLPSHKSHADYLILSYMLYHQDLPCPLVAAGKNLSFWPMGPLFRRGGAFFIRRSFRGAVLYSRVFAEYIHTLLEEGYSIEQFIEGGRSRTGKLLMPRLGLLSIILTAQKSGACRDLIFVPVSIGYDRVPEETSYLQEIEGGQKQPETIWQVIKARKFLRRRYGRVYLQFNAPLSINEMTERLGTSLRSMNPKEFNAFCRNLGLRIAQAINQVSVVTPQALVAAAILNSGRDRFELDDVMAAMEVYLNHLETVGAKLADTLILDHRRAAVHALQSYVQRKILEVPEPTAVGTEKETGFILREAKRPVLDYYRNTCVAFFIPAAFTALAVLQRDAFQFSASDLHGDVEFLKKLFEHEFVLDPDATTEQILRESLQRFYQDAVLVPHPELADTFNVTSAGFRKLKLFAMFLKPFLESYQVVLVYFRTAPSDLVDPKERIKKIASLGDRMLKNKEIDSREALSKVTYENAVQFFTRQGVDGAESLEAFDAFAVATARALRCLTS